MRVSDRDRRAEGTKESDQWKGVWLGNRVTGIHRHKDKEDEKG